MPRLLPHGADGNDSRSAPVSTAEGTIGTDLPKFVASAPGPGGMPPTRVDDDAPEPAAPPTTVTASCSERIGPYRVIGPLGEGGMGVVLQAWQEEPVRRVVAIKLIKLGMDTRTVVERFRMEQQALALMNHPHVARVYEAGATEAGRPYFVMEYVPGEPIVSYCNAFRLDIPARLALFQQACAAIQHAHQKGILHRDLKSGNILVMLQDDRPSVKVIDFGVARATNPRTQFTEVGQFIGTPGYMSPEQACEGSADVDTRSDIYSLGVVLYELLTGMHPVDPTTFRNSGYAEICRKIREIDPPPPSHRLASDTPATARTATYADMDRQHLVRRLRGDLDCIVMKAIEKDPARRYVSAAGLSADIGRYLRNEPVTARRPSIAYRARRFARRHPTGVTATAALAVLLVCTTVLTTAAALRATRAERTMEALHAQAIADRNEALRQRGEAERRKVEAEQAKETLEEVNGFLTSMLTAVRAGRHGPDATVREVLDNASRTIAGRFKDQPHVEASLRHSIGRAYSSLQRPVEAVDHLRRGLDLRQRYLGPNHPDTLWIENNLCNVIVRLRRTDEAEQTLTDVLKRRRDALGARHAETLVTMGQLADFYERTGKPDRAERLLAELVEAHAASPGRDPAQLRRYTARHGLCLASLKRYREAESVLERALALMNSSGMEDSGYAATLLSALADCCRAQGRLEDAAAWEAHGATVAAAGDVTKPRPPATDEMGPGNESSTDRLRDRIAPGFDLPVLPLPW